MNQGWEQKLKGCFGIEDKKFGLHPADEQRGVELKALLEAQGVKWAQVEVEIHKFLEGCSPEHIEEQTKAAKRLLCFGEERK
ncbi:MAG: hypothetical protein KZQ84_00585 [Candidatus Thiodiazotropha sp. (ex Lucinoma borealis)]|nr:hypothetical protein [Candidatus Thiodiazotropha sp. (ex Lucinoma borealis)]